MFTTVSLYYLIYVGFKWDFEKKKKKAWWPFPWLEPQDDKVNIKFKNTILNKCWEKPQTEFEHKA